MLVKIIIIDGARENRDFLKNFLEEDGFEVMIFESSCLLENIRLIKPDLLLLDQILPGKNSTDVVRKIRSHGQYSTLPIMMVSDLSGEKDKVSALNAGVDVYLTKPFSLKELVARIKAMVRRSATVKGDSALKQRIDRGGIVIDFLAHRVWADKNEITLTYTEFKILSELLKHGDQMVTRERLCDLALGDPEASNRTIDVHMASVRRKLGSACDKIVTVRGLGYRFANSPEKEIGGDCVMVPNARFH